MLMVCTELIHDKEEMRRCLPLRMGSVLDGLTSLAFDRSRIGRQSEGVVLERQRSPPFVTQPQRRSHTLLMEETHNEAGVSSALSSPSDNAYLMPAQNVTTSHVDAAQAAFGPMPVGRNPPSTSSTVASQGLLSRRAQLEMSARQGAMRDAFARRPHVEVRGRGGKIYEIPLLPSQYLRTQGASRRGLAKMHADEERLHHITQLNKLAAIDDVELPFRCLRCFRVFEAIPAVILKPQVGDLSASGALKDAQSGQMKPFKSARESARWRARNSVQSRSSGPLKGCPGCSSTKVQWLCEYAHRALHTPIE